MSGVEEDAGSGVGVEEDAGSGVEEDAGSGVEESKPTSSALAALHASAAATASKTHATGRIVWAEDLGMLLPVKSFRYCENRFLTKTV